MLRPETYDDVTRIVMSTGASRAIGYDVSAYFVRGVLIDVGFPAVARDLARWLTFARPSGAMITHHHEDHAGNAELVARAGIPMAASRATLALLRAPAPLAFYRRAIWGTPRRLVTPIEPLADSGLAFVATPGHAADHHVVWDAERETVFGGDLFLGVKVRAAHPEEDPRRLVDSVRAIAALRPTRLFDAHRGLVRSPETALRAKADWLEAAIGTIDDRIDAGWSDRAIVRDVLGREELSSYVSRGAMSKRNLVARVRATRPAHA